MPKVNGNNRKSAAAAGIKTESITLRIEKDVLGELRNEAEQKMESLNTLSNQVLKSYIQWHKPATKSGSFYIQKPVMVKLLEYLSDEQIAEVAELSVNSHIKDTVTMITGEFTSWSYLNSFRIWLDLSNFSYVCDKNDNDYERYVIKFDMGKKFNFYMGKFLQFVFELLKVKDVQIEITEYAIMFRIKKKE